MRFAHTVAFRRMEDAAHRRKQKGRWTGDFRGMGTWHVAIVATLIPTWFYSTSIPYYGVLVAEHTMDLTDQRLRNPRERKLDSRRCAFAGLLVMNVELLSFSLTCPNGRAVSTTLRPSNSHSPNGRLIRLCNWHSSNRQARHRTATGNEPN